MDGSKAIFLLIFVIGLMIGQVLSEWEDKPFTAVNEGFIETIESTKKNVLLEYDENVKTGTVLGTLNYKGSIKPDVSFPSETNTYFKLSDDKRQLVASNEVDYETKPNIDGFMTLGDTTIPIKITIRNLNDNPTIVMQRESCNVKENGTTGATECKFEVNDEDGMMDKFTINHLSDNDDIFKFEWETLPTPTTRNGIIVLHTLQILDYEDIKIYVFDWTIKDNDDRHSDSVTTKVVVNVEDIDDNPPRMDIITSIEVMELENFEMIIHAVDGDFMVNNEIDYTCTVITKKLERYFHWKVENKKLVINIDGINRDEDELELYQYSVKACEIPKDNSQGQCTDDRVVTIMVKDINNQIPLITIDNDQLDLLENKYSIIGTKIEINDKDIGENAKYEVELISEKVKNINEIFQIVPMNGYQKGTFTLNIINAALLDYDDPNKVYLHDFNIEIHSIDLNDATKSDRKSIHVNLINWNDELPTFTNDGIYDITMKETFGRNGIEVLPFTEKICVTDKDVDDKIEVSLLGTAMNSILKLNEDEDGCITLESKNGLPKGFQLFNYEANNEVLIQIKAVDTVSLQPTDTLHTTIGIVTVKLIDVNDEAPKIVMMEQSVSLVENQKKDTLINQEKILGYDEDTLSKLEFKIDWKKSYPSKNGQRVEWEGYEECIDVINIERDDSMECELYFNNKIPNNTPDFEKFDTFYINLVLTDHNTEVVGYESDEVIFVINIKDDNDNPPIFTENSLVEKSVKENADSDIIGVVTATDIDLNPKITYSLEPVQGTADNLLKIDPDTGEISIDKPKAIDADTPPLNYLYYNIKANDEKHTATKPITVKVIDLNDMKPSFTIFPDQNINIPEKDQSVEVFQVKAIDEDRDTPHNQFEYIFKDVPNDKFVIDDEGLITVNGILDRDAGETEFLITVLAVDNPNDPLGEPRLTTSMTFTVIVTDINDNHPEIVTNNFFTTEELKKGKSIGGFVATDRDDPLTGNGKMTVELVNVESIAKNKLTLDDLKLNCPKDNGICELYSNTDMRGHYGDHYLEFKVCDKGQEKQLCAEENTKIPLTIEIFNFEKPSLSVPQPRSTVYLSSENEQNQQLTLFDGSNMDPITGTDNQGEKNILAIEILDTDTNIFKLQKINNVKYNLLLNDEFVKDHKYIVKLKITESEKEALFTEEEFNVKFIDANISPLFNKEADPFVVKEYDLNSMDIPQAEVELEGIEIDIFYHIFEDLNDAFEIDIKSGRLSLVKPLKILDMKSEQVVIQAGTSRTPIANPNKASLLTVPINLIDVNDNDPEFTQEKYFGRVMLKDDPSKILVEIIAKDDDPDDELTFSISNFEGIGSNLPSTNTLFEAKSSSRGLCEIHLKVPSIDANMQGYFTFDITVSDSEHVATASVSIFIVGENHLVKFVFENKMDDVVNKKTKIIEIFNKQLEMESYLDSIFTEKSIYAETPTITETNVTMFFMKDNVPKENDDIKKMLSNADLYGSLRNNLLDYDLHLKRIDNVNTEQENNEEVLKAWLIGVGVVLGSLCILLIVAFILKTRSLNQRLNKLTTAPMISKEDLRMAPPPMTNSMAVEGANPIFHISEHNEKMNNYDRASISSAESDLIDSNHTNGFR
ncbi:PREDICTED: cadherin-23-like [Nicrophorus vespilloides]|uniref:Cadherin-23-like n=1 Tax=Nicrophorus vespilloides TaxID=110193 RepID=A0ABM1MCM6_NICVS|nr:PREDICTED: cadherin-23-like [Nicrophorus vespilloides]